MVLWWLFSWRSFDILYVMMLDFVCRNVGYHFIITINISLFLITNIGASRYFMAPWLDIVSRKNWTYYTFSDRAQWALSGNRVHFIRRVCHSAMLSVLSLLSLCAFYNRVIDVVIDLIVDWTIYHCSVIMNCDLSLDDHPWKHIESTMWLILNIQCRLRI